MKKKIFIGLIVLLTLIVGIAFAGVQIGDKRYHFITLTSEGLTIRDTFGDVVFTFGDDGLDIAGTLTVDGVVALGTVLPVASGGTGATTLADGGILLGSGTSAITALGAATNGQIPVGDGTTDPVLATITGTADEVVVTNGAGSITLSAGAGLSSLGGLTETNGGLPYGTADNAYAWLAAGAEGALLMGNGAGAPSFLAAGTAGYYLIGAGAADPVWTTQPTLTSLEGITITNGGILYGTAADTLANLAAGAEGTLLMGNGAGAPSFLAAGAAYQVLRGAGAADPTWADIPIITGGVGTGVTSTTGVFKSAMFKSVISYTQFDSAGTTHDFTIGAVPDKSIIHAVVVDQSTAFVCAAVCTTATLSATLGTSAGDTSYLESWDMDTGILVWGDADAEVGDKLDVAGNTNSGYIQWASSDIILRATSGTGNWGDGAGATNLNAGALTFYVFYSIMDLP